MKRILLLQLIGLLTYCHLSAETTLSLSTTEACKNITHIDTSADGLIKLCVKFGTYNMSETKEIDIILKNTSDAVMVITNANWAGPMFSVVYDKAPIAPGETAVLHYKSANKRVGPFSKTSVITLNDNTQFLVSFYGIINPDVTNTEDIDILKK